MVLIYFHPSYMWKLSKLEHYGDKVLIHIYVFAGDVIHRLHSKETLHSERIHWETITKYRVPSCENIDFIECI